MQEGMEIIDAHFKNEGLSRRDAMKLLTLGGMVGLMGNATASPLQSSEASAKILIVGGGLAGIATAARLSHYLENPDITIIEPNEFSVSYQAGQTLVAGGIWEDGATIYRTDDFLPSGVTLIREKAMMFDPEHNFVRTSEGKKVAYDYLVVATGLKLDFSKIEGLGIAETITSRGDDAAVRKSVGKNGVTSIYFANGAVDTWTNMQHFVEAAKKGKRVKGIFTQPSSPIKCTGAPKKIMYLTDARLREAGVRDNASLSFYLDGRELFEVPTFKQAIQSQFEERDITWLHQHNLIKVDTESKIATFDKHKKVKAGWDEALEQEVEQVKHERVEVPFDFLHITPPMVAVEEVANSPIGSDQGWVPVNKETLQHTKYPNIFALGDIAGIPMGKTGGSIREQYKVVVENLIAVMEGKEPVAKYHGYTLCPIITSLGTVMLAEYDWRKKPTPTFPLDPTKERWIWWLLELYLLKPLTQYGLLSGRL